MASDKRVQRYSTSTSRSFSIIGPRRYRLATVPTTITLDQVKQLLGSIDRRSALGRRHYAMLLLLAVYGLRA